HCRAPTLARPTSDARHLFLDLARCRSARGGRCAHAPAIRLAFRRARAEKSLGATDRWCGLGGALALAMGVAHADSRDARRVGVFAPGRALRTTPLDWGGETAAPVLRAAIRPRRRRACVQVSPRQLAYPCRGRASRATWSSRRSDEHVLGGAHVCARET